MRSVRRYISEKWFLLLYTFANKFISIFKKHIRTKSRGLHNFSIMEITTVKISVVPYIGSLPHPATSVTIDFGKTAIFWTVRIVIPQVPLSKHSRLVSIFLKKLPECTLIFPQHGATHNGMPYTRPVCPMARHQRCPSW